MRGQKVEKEIIKKDRVAEKGIIFIGSKSLYDISFAPALATERETNLFVDMINGESYEHEHALVTKLFNADKTVMSLIRASENSAVNASDYRKSNEYINPVLEFATIIVDPATDSLKYLAHTRDFAKSDFVPYELRRIANKIEILHASRKKKNRASDNETYLAKIDRGYRNFWTWIMQPENRNVLLKTIIDTINSEGKCRADIGLAPVPVIDSAEMLKFTIKINQLAYATWQKGEVTDNCATYLILAPEALSDEILVKKLVSYIGSIKTKIVVFKFKNIKLEYGEHIEEQNAFKNISEAILKLKEKDKDKIIILLEANSQLFPAAASGFDIISTSLSGYDYDWPFRHPKDRTKMNGYYDWKKLVFRKDPFVRKSLRNGGFKHDPDCICSTVKDERAAWLDWHDITRRHYMFCVNKLYSTVYEYIERQEIEQVKMYLYDSLLSNLNFTLPSFNL